eukprot:m.368489 g.368489  ORF g.368489 m.368489 type:complete len:99 (+) comp45172_c0_seq1:650-946(+)
MRLGLHETKRKLCVCIVLEDVPKSFVFGSNKSFIEPLKVWCKHRKPSLTESSASEPSSCTATPMEPASAASILPQKGTPPKTSLMTERSVQRDKMLQR